MRAGSWESLEKEAVGGGTMGGEDIGVLSLSAVILFCCKRDSFQGQRSLREVDTFSVLLI